MATASISVPSLLVSDRLQRRVGVFSQIEDHGTGKLQCTALPGNRREAPDEAFWQTREGGDKHG